MKLDKKHIFIILIASIALIFLIIFVAAIYANRTINLGLDGHYHLVRGNDEVSVHRFIIQDNHLEYDEYDLYIEKEEENTFKISSLKETIYMEYDSTSGTMEITSGEVSTLFVNSDRFDKKFVLDKRVYLDRISGHLMIFNNDGQIIRYDIEENQSYFFNCDTTGSIVRMQHNDGGEAEYYFVDSEQLNFYDMNGQLRYQYVSFDSEYSLSGYKDILDNRNEFNLDIELCTAYKFGDIYFTISQDDRVYQMDMINDLIVINNNSKNYHYYRVNLYETNISGNYSTNDVMNILLLNEDRTGNLTLNGTGMNFEYIVYNKYLLFSLEEDKFIIPYTISDTGMELSITIDDQTFNFYKLRSNTSLD